MSQLVVAPMLVALAAAVLTLLARWVGDAVYRGVSLVGVLAYAVAVAALVRAVLPGDTIAYQLGDWPAPFGITLVADPLSAFMLSFTAIVAVASLVFGVRYVDDYGEQVSFHPLFHFMLLGVTGSFLTGDIFNLFVWFEVMLMASYVLVVFYSGPEHTRAALQYVVLNLVGSALMLVAIGGIYATVGTLNMADVARRLSTADPAAAAPILGLSAILFAVFALKAGVVPFQFWVPPAYAAAPAPITAMLAGVVKKVGIYAIIRLYFTVFAAAPISGLDLPGFVGDSVLGFYGPVLLVLAAASIVFGGVAAIARDSMDGLLAYSSIGQVGFIVLPLAVAATVPGLRALAVAAALVYTLNHALAKALLFLVAGALRDATGSARFAELGGVAGRSPVLAAAFLVGGLALVGIPPLTGFFGKLLVFDALAQGGSNVGLAAALGGALLTIAYVSSAWSRGFWGDQSDGVAGMQLDRVELAVVAALALCIVAVGVGFDPAIRFAEAAAATATDAGRDAYVSGVLGGESA
jgi:multicomponent Na+:H+ antiporter subunit D